MTILPWPPVGGTSISNGGGSVAVSPNGVITITPAANLPILVQAAPPATPNFGLVSIGTGLFDGSGAGHFAGNANGTYIGINAASGYAGSLIDAQIAGAPILRVDASGSIIPIAPPATANRALLQIGNGPIDGLAAGHYTGSASGGGFGANFAGGYAGDLINLQVGGSPIVSATINGLTVHGAVAVSDRITDLSGARGYFSFTNLSDAVQVTSRLPGNRALVAQGVALQTADIFQAADSANHPQFAVANVGTGAAPIWALRVRAVANAESMAQAHVAGANTGRAIQIIDDAGVSLGWLNLTA